MSKFVTQQAYIDGKIRALSKMIPQLKIIHKDAESLVTTINHISESSEKISGKIRELDTARVTYRPIHCQNCIFKLKMLSGKGGGMSETCK